MNDPDSAAPHTRPRRGVGRLTTRLQGADRLRIDTMITAGAGLGIHALALITGPLLARALDTDGRGDLAAVLVPTQVLGFILLMGVPHASAYYATRHDARTMVTNAWILALTVSAPIALIVGWLAPHYLDGHDPVTVPWFRAFLVTTVLFLPVSTCLDILRARGETTRYNLLRSMPVAFNAAGLIACAVLGVLDLPTALLVSFVTLSAGSFLVLLLANGVPRRRANALLLRAQIRYGFRAAGGTLSQMVLSRFDQFLMVAIVEPASLGLYAVAATGASISSPIGQGIALALFSHVRDETDDVADDRTDRAVLWAFSASILVAAGIAVVAPFGVPLLFGAAFAGSVAPMLLLLPGQVALDVANVYTSRLEADGRPGIASIGLAAGALVTVVGIPVVVPEFGIRGAAIVTSISYFVYLSVVAGASRWGSGRSPSPAPVSEPAGASL